MFASVAARRAETALDVNRRVAALQSEVAAAEEELKRLDKTVEDGVADPDDIPKDRFSTLKLDRDRARAGLDGIQLRTAAPTAFDSETTDRVSRAIRESAATGKAPLCKACSRSVVDRIEADGGVVRIIRDKSTLEHAVAGKAVVSGGVRKRVPKWRTTQDETANTYIIEIPV